LLGHLLLLIGFTIVLLIVPPKLPSSNAPAAVPSYLAPSPEAPSAPAAEQKADPTPEPKQEQKQEQKPVEKNGIEKPVPKKSQQSSKFKRTFDPSTVSFSRESVPEVVPNRDQEPLRLVGEDKIVKPLVKILARALSKHLTYPRVAADFNLRGIVAVGFVLTPEGYVTEAKVVQSSGAGVLDDAARDAVAAMSPVGDVREFVPEPQFLVIGIIFG
jgi:protein TonB